MAWLGALPKAAFSGASAVGQMETAAEPYVWGEGGRRMTPEDIALERQMAEQRLQAGADYSPVQHWAQGLARVAQGIAGGLQMADLRKAGQANSAEGDAITRALMSGGAGQEGGADAVTAALMNPNTPEHVRELAMLRYKQMNPEPQKPTEFERELQGGGVMPGTPEWVRAMRQRVALKTDPETVVTLPGGGIFIGPRSELSAALTGGGGPVSTGSGGMPAPPKTLPPDFDAFDKGGPAPRAPGTFP